MNAPKHTPGPWIVDEVSEDEAGQETLGIYAEEGGYVAVIHCGPTIYEQDKADARLIAAAPAMYEALSRLFDGNVDCGTYWKIDISDMQAAKEALAQASGRNNA